MSTTPQISVVVPTQNTADLTIACLGSLKQGGVEELEIVVVDDASCDETFTRVARAEVAAHVLRNDEARGFSASVNRGLRAARGEILLLLNSDTEVMPGALAALAEDFRADTRLGVVGARLEYPHGALQWSGGDEPSLLWLFGLASGGASFLGRLRARRHPPSRARRANLRVNWVTGAAMAIRREAWETVGPLDEGFRFYGQDLDFCSRATRLGWRIEISSGFRVAHHHGATIGRSGGSVGRQNPELLWSDLVRWASKHRGVTWARRAARVLRLGGRLRLAARRFVELSLRKEARRAWRRDSLLFRRAIFALETEARRCRARPADR